MVDAGTAGAVMAKGAMTVGTPFGKINTTITVFVLMFLLIYGSVKSVEQRSVYPLMDSLIFKTVGADHKLSQSLDSLDPVLTEGSPKFLSTGWFSYWWQMFVLWFDVLVSLWFIWIVIYALYKLFGLINIESSAVNFLYAIATFGLLQLLVGLALYPTTLAGQTMPSDKVVILNDAFGHSYPFEGVVKLGSRIVRGDIFDRVYAFTQSDLGQIVTNVPTSTINTTGV